MSETEAKANSGIEQSRAYETPDSCVRSTTDEMSGGGGEGAEGVGDDLGVINLELVEDLAAPKIEVEPNNKKEQSRGGEEIDLLPELDSSHIASVMSLEEHGLFKKLQSNVSVLQIWSEESKEQDVFIIGSGDGDVYTAGVKRSGKNSTVKVDPVQCSQTVRPNVTIGSEPNLKRLEQYKFDGFRFDGVTSMMYTHHGLQLVLLGFTSLLHKNFFLNIQANLLQDQLSKQKSKITGV